jgi:aldehyde:ferredoxin oxidoreductase
MSSATNRGSTVLVLDVDLSSGKVEKYDLGREMREKYLGSRGVNARILYDSVGPETDAFSPDNLFMMGTGVLGGAGVPGCGRMSVNGKSPFLTYGYSAAGGFFGPEFRRAGYDHLIVRGKAEKPVYLWINDDKVEIRSAAHLWGKNTFDTDRLIKEETGAVSVLSIGQAGEKLLPVSNYIFDTMRATGGKLGGVGGSKNIKAFAVKGTGRIDLGNNKERVRELSRDLIKKIRQSIMYEMFTHYAAAHSFYLFYQSGFSPIKNMTTFEWEAIENYTPDAITKYFTKMSLGCPGCPVHHHPCWEIKEGPYAGTKGTGLEGGPVFSYGGEVGNPYVPAMYKAISLCNDYGIDIFESGQVIGAAFEWFEKGLLSKDDCDGLELKWGNYEAVIELIHKIGKQEGIGKLLGKGVVDAAEEVGKNAKDHISYIKGRSSGWMDYRILREGYLNESTATPAGEMMDGWAGFEEVAGTYGYLTPEYKDKMKERYGKDAEDCMDPLSYNKAPSAIWNQDFAMLLDTVEVCFFVSEWVMIGGGISKEDVMELFRLATGIDMSDKEIMRACQRIRDLERAFWIREGLTRKDDHVYGKFHTAIPNGPRKGEKLDLVKVDKMLDDYYRLRGWDLKTGIPTRKKLLEDGLEDVIKDLEKRGKHLT